MHSHRDRRSTSRHAVAIAVTKEQVDDAVPQALFIAFNLLASAAVAAAIGFVLV